jgi:hypothetical protein
VQFNLGHPNGCKLVPDCQVTSSTLDRVTHTGYTHTKKSRRQREKKMCPGPKKRNLKESVKINTPRRRKKHRFL